VEDHRRLPTFLSIHWAWLLGGGILESILQAHFHLNHLSFINLTVIWGLVQAGWLSRVDWRSTAIYWYGASCLMSVLIVLSGHSVWIPTSIGKTALIVIDVIWGIAGISIAIIGIFVFRRDMERYFNETEDAGLLLGPWMTLFFSTLYFQYYFHDLAQRHCADTMMRITG
jgi:hypothetical protein